jgi:hypothetical protein
MRKALVAILALMLLMIPLLAIAPAVSANPALVDVGSRTVSVGEYNVLRSVRADGASSLTYSVDVTPTTGIAHPIDVLLLNESNFFKYKDGLSFVFLPGSALAVTNVTETEALATGQIYYLVADNTNAPFGGANPVSEVRVFFSLVGTNVTPLGERVFDLLLIIAIVAIVVIAVIVLLVIFLLVVRKPTRYHQAPPPITPYPPPPPEAKPIAPLSVQGSNACPSCGYSLPSSAAFCPSCGRKL